MSEVTIYVEPGCPFSMAAKEDLARRGIAYREVDVTASREALEEMLRITGGERMVPVIVEGDKVTLGFGGG